MSLVEQALTALNEADPIGLLAIIGDDPTHPSPDQEYRLEAEAIARGIRHEELSGRLLCRDGVAAIVRSVIHEYFEERLSRKESRAVADRLCALRLIGQLHEAVAAEAADVLADGRAVLLRGRDEPTGEWVELVPNRDTAAKLHAFVEYEALVNLFVADYLSMEFYSIDPNDLLSHVRVLVRALIAGEYSEEEREGTLTRKIHARWPPDNRCTYVDATEDAGGEPTEWRKRAYDPY